MAQSKMRFVEISAGAGGVYFPGLDKIDKQLADFGHPKLADDIDVLQGAGGNIKVNFKQWGIFYGTYAAYIRTEANKDKYYYTGSIDRVRMGVSYDILKRERFMISPYLAFGFHQTSIFLDYEFENGVTPTSLKITGEEAIFAGGLDLYFRLKAWQDGRLQLFLKGEASYALAVNGWWRFDNMRINSKDFNSSAIDVNASIVLRYNFGS